MSLLSLCLASNFDRWTNSNSTTRKDLDNLCLFLFCLVLFFLSPSLFLFPLFPFSTLVLCKTLYSNYLLLLGCMFIRLFFFVFLSSQSCVYVCVPVCPSVFLSFFSLSIYFLRVSFLFYFSCPSQSFGYSSLSLSGRGKEKK